jgi:glycosyltransferase involved in cell wall biosynthesis
MRAGSVKVIYVWKAKRADSTAFPDQRPTLQELTADGADRRFRLGVLSTHPIQYYVPWYRALAKVLDLQVFYCHQQTARGQADAGFGVEFEWDVPLLGGYQHQFLENISKKPDVSAFDGCNTPSIKSLIQNGRFDAFVVQGWYVKSFWQAMWACWRNRTPVLVRGDSQLSTPRNPVWRMAKYPIFRSFIPRFDGYLVVGERSRQYYLNYGARSDRMFFAPHAVDNGFFAERVDQLRENRESIRRQWGIPIDALVFLFAGKLILKKRPSDFVQAIAAASQENKRVFGLIAGDGPMRSEVERTVVEHRLPIVFTGFLNQSEMPNAYAASDALVLPSDGGETWGLVVNEAMAAGLPAIVSDKVGCGPDLVSSDVTGEMFACGDIEFLAKIFVKWAANPEQVKQSGKNAKERIAKYSVESAVNGTLQALRSVSRDQSQGR